MNTTHGYHIDAEQERSAILSRVAKAQLMADSMNWISELFARIPCEQVYFCFFYPEGQVIAHVKTRSAFAPIRAMSSGVWSKVIDTEDGEILVRYTGHVRDIRFVVKVSELPPSCKIVTEEVPETLVPAHSVQKVVCNGVETQPA